MARAIGVNPGRRRATATGGRRRRWIRRGRDGHAAITISLAPMIDMAFLFLIFFLVTTTFERAEGILSSKLPEDTGRPTVALPVSPIVIRLAPTGLGNADCSIRVDRFENVPQRVEALPDFLRRIHELPGFDRDTPVVIVPQDEVRWDHVVGCWNAALLAKCTRIAFAEP